MINSPSFLKFLHSLPGIGREEVETMLGCFRVTNVKSREFILREGEICKQIGYVDNGCFSYYRLLPNGKKSIIHFAFEDWWIGDLESFLNRKPANTFLQALEDAVLISLNRSDFEKLQLVSPAFNALFNKKTQDAYLKAVEKLSKEKSETAEEKYVRMMNEYPQILQRVPHYDIAAYLGIAPESLSRIRNKIAKGG